MSWSEVKLLKDRLNVGTRALPLLIIEDVLNTLGGKTLTITNGTYTHTVGFPQGESMLPITLECLGDWDISYTDNGNTVTKTATVDKVGGVMFSFLPIVSWSSGTDEQIVAMVQAADQGLIDLSDYWSVGDERTVSLSAMSATGVSESHVAQDITLVLANSGGKTLVTPTASGRTECSFIWIMKDCLKEKGYINESSTNSGGWDSCTRRTWCNTVFKNALPSTLLPIFKQFQNKTSIGSQSTTLKTSDDWFAIDADIEVHGVATYSASGEGTQFTYYQTSANIIKKVNGSNDTWWGRSPDTRNNTNYRVVGSGGTSDSCNAHYVGAELGISVIGVI